MGVAERVVNEAVLCVVEREGGSAPPALAPGPAGLSGAAGLWGGAADGERLRGEVECERAGAGGVARDAVCSLLLLLCLCLEELVGIVFWLGGDEVLVPVLVVARGGGVWVWVVGGCYRRTACIGSRSEHFGRWWCG
ncbi:hypothetical protein BJ912DRAFT_944591 [Pholiota molesta]|nr:hypothetical protein BJ912DRAFT_944591 [Pholiota molesta]